MSESDQPMQVTQQSWVSIFQEIRHSDLVYFDTSIGSPFAGYLDFDRCGFVTIRINAVAVTSDELRYKYKHYPPCKLSYQTAHGEIVPLIRGPLTVAKALLENKEKVLARTNIVSSDWSTGRFSFVFSEPVSVGGYKAVNAVHFDYDYPVSEWEFPHPTPAKIVWKGSRGHVHAVDENGNPKVYTIDGVYFTLGPDDKIDRDVFPYGCESHQICHRLKPFYEQASLRVNYQSELHFYFDKPNFVCGVPDVSGVHFMYGDVRRAKPQDIYRRTFDSAGDGSGQAAVSMGQAGEGGQADHKRKLDPTTNAVKSDEPKEGNIASVEEDSSRVWCGMPENVPDSISGKAKRSSKKQRSDLAGVSAKGEAGSIKVETAFVKDKELFVATVEWAKKSVEDIVQGILDQYPAITREALLDDSAFPGLKLCIRRSTRPSTGEPKVTVSGRAPVESMVEYLKTREVNWLGFEYDKDINLPIKVEDRGEGGCPGDAAVVVGVRQPRRYDQVALTEQEYDFRQRGYRPIHIDILLRELIDLIDYHIKVALRGSGK